MLGLEKLPQITDEGQKTFYFHFYFIFLESCRERHSPYSFVAFNTAFTNPEIGFFILYEEGLPILCACVFPQVQADAVGATSVSQVL